MMAQFNFLCLYFMLWYNSSHFLLALDANVVQNYLHFKFASKACIYHCFAKRDEISFVKRLPKNVMVRLFNVKNLNITSNEVCSERDQKLAFIIDGINCPHEHVLVQLSRHTGFTFVHPVLISLRNETTIESVFNRVNLSISSDLQVITVDYRVFDVYNPSTLHGGKLISSTYQHWNSEHQRFARTNGANIYWTRRDMRDVKFQSKVVLPIPFRGRLEDYLFSDSEREVNSLNRFHVVLMYHVRDYYNYTLQMGVSRSWGYLQPNGSFDGIVRALELGKIDFSASPLFVKEERMRAVQSAFLFRLPKRRASFEVFLRPLEDPVWYVTIAAIVFIVLLLRLSLRSEKAQEEVENAFEVSWSHIILFTLGALCQQGSSSSPNGISGRITFIFIFIFTVLLYQFYSASIVAILIMTPVKLIRNLHDLAFSSLVLGCEDTLYNRDYINKLVNDSIVGRLSRKSPKGNEASFFVSPEVGIARVAASGYAYHVELATAYPLIAKMLDEDAICSLDEIELFRTQPMHQTVQKGSPFREMLDHVLHKIDESGLMRRQQKHWHARKPECIRSQPLTTPVSIQEFYPALSLLLFAMVISFLVFIVEHITFIYAKYKHKANIIKQMAMNRGIGLITHYR